MIFVCPKCSSRFVSFRGNSAVCENGHCYDKSREGYYNFLPPSSPHTHGDNKEMLLARRAFLDTGLYGPLADGVVSLALKHAPHARTLLDIGCGEGYYTRAIMDAFKKVESPFSLAAFDISKDAVRLAAKRAAGADFAVASAYRVPILDLEIDLAFNMFSPLALSEIVRLLSPSGVFVMAIPDENHLFELKAAIYDTPYKNEPQDFSLSGLTLLESRKISYKMKLDTKEKILSLFTMTPYAYRTRNEDVDRLLSLDSLDVTASFIVIVYKKSC